VRAAYTSDSPDAVPIGPGRDRIREHDDHAAGVRDRVPATRRGAAPELNPAGGDAVAGALLASNLLAASRSARRARR
jgi:hypothetical protein